MERMETVANDVKRILTENKEARNSDRVLMHAYYRDYYAMKNRDLDKMTAKDFLLDDFAPSTETVRRARQKCQERNPELRATPIIQIIREEKQEEMCDWARATKGVES